MKELQAKLEVIRDMTDTEGVKQLCDVLMQLIPQINVAEIGFKRDSNEPDTH